MSRWLRRQVATSLSGNNTGPGSGRFAAVIVKLDRLGDFVLALAAIRLLLQRYGEDRCLLVISPVAEPLARREFPRTARLVMPASLGHVRAVRTALQFKRILSGCSAPIAICLRHQRWDYDELVLSWIPAREHLRLVDGYTRRLAPHLRTFEFDGPGAVPHRERSEAFDLQPTRDHDGLCQELVMHRLLVEHALGRSVEPDQIRPTLPAPAAAAGTAIIATPMGSEAIKDFPVSLLAEALAQCRERLDLPVRLFGTSEQHARLQEILHQLAERGIHRVTVDERLSFDAYANAISDAPMVVTTDTATAHLATACDRRALILLGAGHYGQFGPWWRSARQQWLTHRVDCFGCNWACRHPEPFCITKVAPADLRSALHRLFDA